ncbi:hypothetical protein [Cellulomonas fimi]|uniref:Uncharacterized protein n=1 Tax=Cellulomonas fimi TaxID=1708 RepID=A0A7Y0QH82_CELFI|nr:hypothetical protein [Cellulomonas fimi]NMR19908.1 hypothetical protein [Cellulomonas fimi]
MAGRVGAAGGAGVLGPFAHLQGTTLALRARRALGVGPEARRGARRARWWPPVPVADVAARRRASLPVDQQDRYDAALLSGSAPAPVLERAFAAGAPLDAVEALGGFWAELTPRERAQVAAPLTPARGTRYLRWGAATATQVDQTTCGSAVLAMLAAASDPLLALWLATGRTAAGHLPREVAALRPDQRGAAAAAAATGAAATGAAARFGMLQLTVKERSSRAALGPLPWPARLGTPPWGAARVARHVGAAFASTMVDDTDAGTFGGALDRAGRSLATGVPVPLFTGGDLSSGLWTAVPRHVVLLVPRPSVARAPDAAGWAVYEPSRGVVVDITREELLAPAGPRAAYGGWSHVCWMVLPQRPG